MHSSRRALGLGFLLLLAAAAALRAEGLGGYVQQDFFPLETTDPAIVWKATWDDTLLANTARWKDELGPRSRRGESVREVTLKLRTARLLEKLIEHFPDETDRRIDACRQIGATYQAIYAGEVRLNYVGRGNYFYKKLAEEFPGRIDLAVPALGEILDRTSSSTAEGAEWSAYASDRLIALREAGYLDDDHASLALAWYARARLRRSQRRFVEAWSALDKAQQLGAGEVRCRVERADLLLDAGRWIEAAAMYREIQPVAGDTYTSHVNARIDDLAQPQDIAQADFPRDVPLEAQWEAMVQRKSGAPADVLHAILAEAAASKGAADWGEGRQRSLWSAIDDLMGRQKDPFLSALRGVQAQASRPVVQAALREGGDDDAIIALYRRYPWSEAVHEAMLALADRRLRQGHKGLALRTFQDVLAHAGGRETRSRAQAGLWLAGAALAAGPDDIQGLFAGVDEKETFTWLGSPMPAGSIRKLLLDSLKASQPPPAAEGKLTVRPLTVPPPGPADAQRVDTNLLQLGGLMASELCRLSMLDGRCYVSGPSILACYGPDTSRPLWARTARLPRKVIRAEKYHFETLQRFRPALDGGRLFCRWGLDDTGRNVSGLAAFDPATGEMLWSAGEDIFAVSDPVAADGRLYVLSVDATVGTFCDLHLVCLSADSGREIWRKIVVSQEVRRWGVTSPDQRDDWGPMLYEGSLLADRGAVYCQSNLGFVARYDARDGLLDWRVQYPRTYLWRERRDVLRRRGHVPLAAGARVVFLPQDYAGLFALDARSGERVWDNALAPSEELAGVADGILLTVDTRDLAAIDAADGTVLWTRHFEEGLNGLPVAAGPSVYAAAGNELLRLDLRTGQAVQRTSLPAEAAIAHLAVRGDSLLTVPAVAPDPPPRAPTAPVGPLHPPLKQAWHLPRRNAALLVPPPEANLPGRTFLLSNDILECIRTDLPGGVQVLWRRGLANDWDWLYWQDGGLLFVYRRQAILIDARGGAVRWETRLPFAADYWFFRPPFLVCRDIGYRWASKGIATLDTATGRILWQRSFDSTFNYCLNGEIGFDGKLLYVFATPTQQDDRCVQIALRPTDGRIMGVWPLDIDVRAPPRQVALGEGFGFLRLLDGRIRQFDFGRSEVVDCGQLGREGPREGESLFEVRGPWLRLLWPWWRGGYAVIFKRGEPARQYSGPGREIDGQTLYQFDRQAVTAVDLPTGKRTVYPLGGEASGGGEGEGPPQQVLDVATDGTVLAVLSAVRRRAFELQPLVLHVDLFDARSATPLGGRDLHGVRFANWRGGDGLTRHNELLVAGSTLIVADSEGLTGFVRDRDAQPPSTAPRVVHRMAGPPAIDGCLDDWAAQDSFAMAPADTRQGRVWIAHDARRLYLAVSWADDRVLSRKGRPRCGGGDWVEIGLTAKHASWRLAVGCDERGEPSVELIERPDGVTQAPEGLAVGLGQDLAARRVVYELAVPLRGISRTDEPMREVGVSVGVWSESPAGLGQVRNLTWGRALDSSITEPTWHECVRLHPLDGRAHRSALAIADALGDLAESLELLRSDVEIAGAGPDAAAEAAWAFIQRHPGAANAEALLAGLCRQTPQSADKLLARAAKTGVPAVVLQRVRNLASQPAPPAAADPPPVPADRPYLSQWVWLDPDKPPQAVEIRLGDGREWLLRARWGAIRRESVRLGPLPPAGQWQELRVPLSGTAFQDRPIVGLNFERLDGRPVVWDRTAIVAAGKATVMIDDAPGGQTDGEWKWVDKPLRSGAKAHTGPSTPAAAWHGISRLDRPATAHLPFDPAAAADVLARHVPQLGPTQLALDMLNKLLALESADAKRRIQRYRWFLTAIPDHPKAVDMLGALLTNYREINDPNAVGSVDSLLAACPFEEETVFQYNRRFVSDKSLIVPAWQLIGPFGQVDGGGLEAAYPPETDGVRLNLSYEDGNEVLKWQPMSDTRGRAYIHNVLGKTQKGVAYAACWLNSARTQPALLEMRCDPPWKIWLNGKMISDRASRLRRDYDVIPIGLAAGANELLVKSVNISRRSGWYFMIRLMEAHGRGAPPGVTAASAPPAEP